MVHGINLFKGGAIYIYFLVRVYKYLSMGGDTADIVPIEDISLVAIAVMSAKGLHFSALVYNISSTMTQ